MSGSSSGRPLVVGLVVAVYVAALLRGEWVSVAGVSVTAADVVVAVGGVLAAVSVVREPRVAVDRRAAWALLAVGGFVLWQALRALESPQPFRALTLVVQLLRNVVLFGVVVVLATRDEGRRIERGVFVVAAIAAVVTLVTYPLAVNGVPGFGTFVHWPNQYQTARAQLLVGDPNFFGLLLLVGLLAGVDVVGRGDTDRRGYLLVGAVLLALLLTLSRSVVGLLVGIAALRVLTALARRDDPAERRRLLAGAAGVTVVAVGAVVAFRERIANRLAQATVRGELWAPLLAELPNRPLVGFGLRSAEVAVGRYAHNSYLKIVFESGLVGLALFGGLVALVTLVGVQGWLADDLDQPAWWWSWVAVVPFMFFFTYAYLPEAWLVPALVLATATGREDRRASARTSRKHDAVPRL